MGMMGAPMIAAVSGNDVDFMVHGLIPLKFFGHQVWITTTHVTTLIVMIFILILALAARRAILNAGEKPEGVQNLVELLVETLDNLVQGNMGRHWRPFVNYIGTIMIFIFISNTSGLFGLRPPTADYGTTLALALITFVLIQFSAFKTSGFGVFTDLFKPIPILFPINLIGEFATPLSMSLRLFGNIMAGTIMMALWYGLLPIFAMLTMTFITDKRDA